jgi:hypothetical protein
MERPTGVTIISILGFIGAGCLIFAALGMFLAGAMLSNMAASPGIGALAGFGGAVVAFIFLGIAAVYLVSAIGLWKLQNWGRIMTIVVLIAGLVLYGLGFIRAMRHLFIIRMFIEAIFIAIDLWIVVYLSKAHVRQAFTGSTSGSAAVTAS